MELEIMQTKHLKTVQDVADTMLRTLTILGTYQCTAACTQCCFESSPDIKGRLTLPEIQSSIEQALALSPNLKVVVFSGGEATLLKKDLVSAISYCTKLELATRLVTNASWGKTTKTANKLISELVEAGLTELNISTGYEHQEWVPISSVLNAARASVRKDLTTLIAIESHPHFVDESPQYVELQKLAEKQTSSLTIIRNSWMKFRYDGAAAKAEAQAAPRAVHGPCGQLFTNIVVTPHGNISACCGLAMEHIPEMRLGCLRNSSESGPSPIGGAYASGFNDFLKIWLAVDGPNRILEKTLGTERARELVGNSRHICEGCATLHQSAEAREVIKHHYSRFIPEVMNRFRFQTFELMATNKVAGTL